jgi:hypothetical protein
MGVVAVVPAVYATQYLSVEQAQHSAFPQATEFRLHPSADAALAARLGAPPGWAPQVFEARGTAGRLGWLIVDRVLGKNELITFALALDTTGTVRAVEVLEYREAHGAEVRLAPWRAQFVGKTARDPLRLDQDIKNISGATLSCRHLTEGVRRLLEFYDAVLRDVPSAP